MDRLTPSLFYGDLVDSPELSAQGPDDRGRPHVLVLVEPLPYPFDTRVRAQVAALVDGGYDVTVICPTGFGHDATDERESAAVRVRRFAMPPGGRGAVGYLKEYALAMRRMSGLVRAVEAERHVDLCVVCNPPDLMIALTRRLVRRGTRVLFDYREISPELFEAKFQRRGPLFRALLASERYALRRSDVVITVNEACARIIRERGGVPADRVFIVGNGPDAERMRPVEPMPELRGGHRHLVLWLGAMSQQEGLNHLIAAADELVNAQGRDDVGFAIVGPGDVHDELRATIAARGLEDHVTLSGAVGDDLVRGYMSTASVCLGVDEKNSMNDRAAMRKILEYMAMGRPVVQFPLDTMKELCADATLYARNADSADLARQVARLLDDDALREELGRRAYERVYDGLMWHQQVPVLLEAVRKALEGR